MGKPYNKLIKRARRKAYLKRSKKRESKYNNVHNHSIYSWVSKIS